MIPDVMFRFWNPVAMKLTARKLQFSYNFIFRI